MATLASPVTGSTVSGLTSPTYTMGSDLVAAGTPGVAHYVSALGGTQTGVRTHTVSSPFSALLTRPATLKQLGTPNPVTGRYPSVPSNRFALSVWKGVAVAADQPYAKMNFKASWDVPAGSETYDAANVAACISFGGGLINGNATAIQTALTTGVLVP